MPGKSRGKKHIAQSRKAMLRTAGQPAAEAQAPAVTANAAAPAAPVKRTGGVPALAYPFVSQEVRLFSMLALLIVVILVILTLTFS
ncbi:MAG: hypothetical protein PHR56_00435 [Dehalococcoidales bacterium]|nr:hypothetical protein [Dehalococcoidales bacterium]